MTAIDARGQRCPWPAIRLGRALREGRGPVEIRADDPAAERELAALAKERNCDFEKVGDDRFRILPRDAE